MKEHERKLKELTITEKKGTGSETKLNEIVKQSNKIHTQIQLNLNRKENNRNHNKRKCITSHKQNEITYNNGT